MDLGMIGLGVMGRNLLLNLADHGYAVLGYDREPDRRAEMAAEAGVRRIRTVDSLDALVRPLVRPRVVMLLVPAGPPVDAVLGELTPLLEPGDIVIDGGNSHFGDTNRRIQALARRGIHLLGMGISGGERGARTGPSLMPGGAREAWERVRPMFEAVAARAQGEPCAAWLGPGSAGHYVKMVHNGIEYGLMQAIAECYDFLRRVAGFGNDRLHEVFAEWNRGALQGYLIEITAHIFTVHDPRTGRHLVDLILDQARQKGTGAWTSQEAIELQVPAPTIDASVWMRHLSAMRELRQAAARTLERPVRPFAGKPEKLILAMRDALHAAMLLTYVQGMTLLGRASVVYGYNLNLALVARLWRGGCIIRSALLEPIRAACLSQPAHLLLDATLGARIMALQEALRAVVAEGVWAGIPMPAMSASLHYLDGLRSARLPANLIQAQRDCFGAHGYERIDAEGTFHTDWLAGVDTEPDGPS